MGQKTSYNHNVDYLTQQMTRTNTVSIFTRKGIEFSLEMANPRGDQVVKGKIRIFLDDTNEYKPQLALKQLNSSVNTTYNDHNDIAILIAQQPQDRNIGSNNRGIFLQKIWIFVHRKFCNHYLRRVWDFLRQGNSFAMKRLRK